MLKRNLWKLILSVAVLAWAGAQLTGTAAASNRAALQGIADEVTKGAGSGIMR